METHETEARSRVILEQTSLVLVHALASVFPVCAMCSMCVYCVHVNKSLNYVWSSYKIKHIGYLFIRHGLNR